MEELKIYRLGNLIGQVTLDENELMVYENDPVKNIILSIRESHFSDSTPDEEIFDQLPLILRGQYYCRVSE